MLDENPINIRNVKAIILAGGRDFGRCPLASRMPKALWPIVDKPVLEHLLQQLAQQGIKQAVICSNGDGSMLAESIHIDSHLKLTFLDEQLPSGTAGCVRDAINSETDGLFMVFPAGIVSPPKIDAIMNAHRDGQSDLTVMFNPDHEDIEVPGETSDIYIFEASILKHIPKEGYFDIKEGLIPELLRVGKTVHIAVLPNHAGNFRDWQGYLYAVAEYLRNNLKLNADLILHKHNNSQAVWTTADSKIDPGARIIGPAVIMEGADISEGAIIVGPTIVGRSVTVGSNSVVVNSILWDGAQVGADCEVQRCLIDYNAVVTGNTNLEEKAVSFTRFKMRESGNTRTSMDIKTGPFGLCHILPEWLGNLHAGLADWAQSKKTKILYWFTGSLVLLAFLWSYWPGIVRLWDAWQRSDEYSSGLLVPFLAVYVLWTRRNDIAPTLIKPSMWGLVIFVAAQGFRLFGLYLGYGSAENLSVVLSIAALVLLLFGRQLFKRVSTVLLFLCLMLPWPNRIQAAVALPLQRWATSSAVFFLEMIGYDVIKEGNIIHIGQARVAVAEACNGLRMITAFFVISGLVVLLVRRAWWEKFIILLSSVFIAFLCNTARLAITALAFTVLSGEHWEKIFHDFGGYAMMPLAIAVVVTELWLLTKLTTLPVKEEAIIVARQKL